MSDTPVGLSSLSPMKTRNEAKRSQSEALPDMRARKRRKTTGDRGVIRRNEDAANEAKREAMTMESLRSVCAARPDGEPSTHVTQ
jgi:hypothetical protein